MSFLDNLEDNLKALESREEAQDQKEQQQRESVRAQALAAQPWAEKLKKSRFTEDLLLQSMRVGRSRRLLVRPTWIGTTLRLEAAARRLELRPTPGGVVAAFIEDRNETRTLPVDLDGSAEPLVREWLGA